MADEEIQDSVTKAQQLVAEFAANKQRLKARGVEIGETITAGKFDDAAARDAILELFLELHDTALSLQSDLALVLLDALENPPVVEEEEDDSLLLHADAAQSASDKLCRLLFFCGALKDAGAARVTVAAPYLAYARKDRRTQERDPVTTRYVAQLFEAVGVDAIVTR